MQIVSLAWGILAMLSMLVAFFPCLGALNWLVIPFAFIGLIFSAIIYANAPKNNRGAALAGLVMCSIATLLGAWRLSIGGGIL